MPRLQPALTVLGVLGATAPMLLPRARRAFDAVPLPEVLALFYWRAVFGMCLLAFYTGGVLPPAFALPAAFGDASVTSMMVALPALARCRGGVPRPLLLAWNTLGLLDLVDVMVLLATVVRPWAAERGLVVGNYVLSGFVVPVFIGLHVHLYGRLTVRRPPRRRCRRSARDRPELVLRSRGRRRRCRGRSACRGLRR